MLIIRLTFMVMMSTPFVVAQQAVLNDVTTKFEVVNRKIIALFDNYPLVAVGEGMHNSALTAEWLDALIREKEFPLKVRNIVVEFGASEYQKVMDDFTNGKEVPDSLFKRCWRETTQLFVWDNPVYESFFRQVRNVNMLLPEHKRIRVLLGDPSFDEREKSRDEHAFTIIEKEVLAKNQTALIIYGDLHFVRKDIYFNYASAGEIEPKDRNIVQLLDLKYPGKTFAIWGSVNTNDPSTMKVIQDEKIVAPDLLIAGQSGLGKIDFTAYYPYPGSRVNKNGNDIDSSLYIEMLMDKIVDGIIFRGTWEDQVNRIASRPDEIYSDTIYIDELIFKAKLSNEIYRIQRFQYFKLRWSDVYEPFLETLSASDSIAVSASYSQLKKRYPDFRWMQVLNILGYELIGKKDFYRAIKVFELASREFADQANVYVSLGDGHMANGDKEQAKVSYTKALQIDPENSSGKRKLGKLLYE